MADEFHLNQEEREATRENGAEIFSNRVRWAKTYLTQAGLLESTQRGYFKITDLGQLALGKKPSKIDSNFLKQFPDFVSFMKRGSSTVHRSSEGQQEALLPNDMETPEERIEAACLAIEDALKTNLLTQVHKASPVFFENLILDLLTAMGYGGGREDAAQRVGKTGDGGIDGIIKEDVLGLDAIYLQAKRYQQDVTIGEGEIRGFSGSLIGKGATKGVFVATCKFSASAKYFAANNSQQKIVLIDGRELTRLMVAYNIGVKSERPIQIKKIDSDYFDEYDGN